MFVAKTMKHPYSSVQSSPGSSKGLMRRRWPRYPVRGNVLAHVETLALVMPVLDLSLGGFGVEAPIRFAQGECHDVVLRLAEEPPVKVRTRVAYCRPKGDVGHLFFTGWEALGDPATAGEMTRLVDRFLAGQPQDRTAAGEGPTPGPQSSATASLTGAARQR